MEPKKKVGNVPGRKPDLPCNDQVCSIPWVEMTSSSRKKFSWFRIGVALLSISAVWWALSIFAWAIGLLLWTEAIGMALQFTAIPIGIGIPCVMQRVPAIEKSPWGAGTLVAVSLLASFAAAGIIAGLNWRRMGRHRLMWITMIVSPIALAAFDCLVSVEVSVIGLVGSDLSPISGVGTLVNGGIAWGLWKWQQSAHRAWKESQLQAEQAGWQIPVLVVCVAAMFRGGSMLLWV